MKASVLKFRQQSLLLSLLRISQNVSQILQIHAQLITTSFINSPFTSSQLLTSLTAPNTFNINHAELLFTQIHQPNAFMYNTMIKGYSQSLNPQRALRLFDNMKRNGVLVDNYTYPFVLKACRAMVGLVEGREVHGEVAKRGFGFDLHVANGLIGVYCKCGQIRCARMLFDEFEGRNLVSWNLLLGGYVGCGDIGEAQKMFDEMPEKDVVSWSIMIDGYGKKIGDVFCARTLFDSMPMRDMISWNSMIDGYTKIGEMVAARELFNEMPERNVISWSILIDGYARHGNPKEALNLFRQMLCQGIKPDKVSVVGAVSACAQLGALNEGRWMHTLVKKNITVDIVVQTALLDMYMKCGSLDEARRLFSSMPERNIVSWNVMIVGLGMNGFGEESLDYFALVEKEGIPMDDLIFLGSLTACSHAGLVHQGLRIFNLMRTAYEIEPKLEHYGCLIDLLGRAGQLEQALTTLESMPMKPNPALWGSLLLACQTHRNVALAEDVVERLVEIKGDDCGVYVLLSNIYADVGMWEDASKLRKLMRDRKMQKETGRSIIEVDGYIEEFVSGEKPHFRIEELELVIRNLLNTSVYTRWYGIE